MKGYKYIIFTVIVLSVCIPALIIYQLLNYKQTQISAINNIMLQEAKSHFENAVMTRKWNAQYGGVYVKKNKKIEPNPYLADNHIFDANGQMLVKINPAWMTRQISEISNLHRDYYFKITSLTPLNPHNAPDDFEKRGLNSFVQDRNKPYFYEIDHEKDYFNLIGALKVQKECLDCHAAQNYVIGDIRGGIRVSVPIKSHNAKINKIKSNTIFSIIVIITLAAIINFFLIRFILTIVKQNKEYLLLNQNLEKRVQEEIEKNQQKEKMLSQQSKLAALGEMLNNIAHQWRQPLSTITTATSGMQLEREVGALSDEEFNKNTKVILEQANYMSKTIDDFKNFFKSDKQKTRFNLKNLIIKDIELIKSSYSGYNINVDIEEIDSHISLYGYQNELSQALLNILNNAKDQFIKQDIKDREITISTQFTNSHVDLLIHDNAGGIAEDIIEKVFEPYFTTKHQSQGTGIGLYMTRQIIVDHMQGFIEVSNETMKINSVLYEGACFKISLPIASELE